MNDKYILDENDNPVLEPNLMKWSAWYEANRDKRRVARDKVGEYEVSTVFLTFDHGWDGGPPVLWETMIFGGKYDDWINEYQVRYTSLADAKAGHAEAVALASQPEVTRKFKGEI
jgi:hypothetical protein